MMKMSQQSDYIHKATTIWIIVSRLLPTCLSSHCQPFLLLYLFSNENIDDAIVIFSIIYSLFHVHSIELQAEFVISMPHSVLAHAHVSHSSSCSA